LFQPHLKYTLTFFHTCTSLFHSSVHFFPVLVKGLYQTDPSWLSSGTSIKSDGVKLVYSRFFSTAFFLFNKNNRKRKSHDFCTTIGQWSSTYCEYILEKRDIEFTYFYDFSIECWNCSDSVIYMFSFYYRLWKKPAELQLLKKNMVVIVFRN
jgi:hypothetical protein